MVGPVDPPTLDLDVADLTDWLELSAIFNEFGVARIDALQSSLVDQQESAEDNIGEDDRYKEAFRESVENEITLRTKQLGDAYPFSLSVTAHLVG